MNKTPFSIADFPLVGMQVIEASAGTGKTFSLVALAIKAVVERGLTIDRLLIVTFTEAAAKDLKTRLRQGLRDAYAAALQADFGPEPSARILSALSGAAPPAIMAQRLKAACLDIDQAAVHTIHGFCRRMQEQHADLIGDDWSRKEIGPHSALWREVCFDYWYAEASKLPLLELEFVRDDVPGPDALLSLASSFDLASVVWDGIADLEERCVVHCRLRERALAQLRAMVEEDPRLPESACALLAEGAGLSRARGAYDERALAAIRKHFAVWLRHADDAAVPDYASLLAQDRIDGHLLPSAAKKGLVAPRHALFEAVQALIGAERSWRRCVAARFKKRALAELPRRFAARAEQLGLASYDQLIDGFRDALAGTRGKRLRRAVLAQFPLAIVDEFQDTSPGQYAIFKTVYGGEPDAGLVLIGDPKQAIYRFRDGDVYAYRSALADSGNAVHCLTTNWRSEAGLLACINAMFGHRDKPFNLDFIDYDQVEVGMPPRFVPLVDPARAEHLIAWLASWDGQSAWNQDEVRQLAVDRCVAEIARLLEGGAKREILLDGRPVRASDIAVLAMTNEQVEQVAEALSHCGIAVSASAQENIFLAEEAEDLVFFLRALLAPRDDALLKDLLCRPLFGMVARELAEEGSLALVAWRRKLAEWSDVAERHGAMPAVFAWLHFIAVDVLRRADGGARLSKLRQLAQRAAAHAGAFSARTLLRWYGARMRQSRAAPLDEAAVCHDPSEDGVVVSTVHRSKGLEFGIVFYPFAWHGARASPAMPVRYHDAQGALHVDLLAEADSPAAQKAHQEELDEQIRVTYVALTRAIHRVYAVFAGLDASERSGLGQLLYAGMPLKKADLGQLQMPWLDIQRRAASLIVEKLEAIAPPKFEPASAEPSPRELMAARLRRELPRGWHAQSFSALQERELADENEPLAVSELWLPGRKLYDARAFGSCFHAVMENAAFAAGLGDARQALIAEQMRRYGIAEEHKSELIDLVERALRAELLPGTRLTDLRPEDRLIEMGFAFPLPEGGARMLVNAVRGQQPHAAEVLEIEGDRLMGQMKGFVDLVFCAHGRYHVLDYKTNYFSQADDYSAAALTEYMEESGYALQYSIYAIALHRYLRLRLGERYSPKKHLGCVCYLFVRGLDADRPDRGIFRQDLDADAIVALDWALAPREAERDHA